MNEIVNTDSLIFIDKRENFRINNFSNDKPSSSFISLII